MLSWMSQWQLLFPAVCIILWTFIVIILKIINPTILKRHLILAYTSPCRGCAVLLHAGVVHATLEFFSNPFVETKSTINCSSFPQRSSLLLFSPCSFPVDLHFLGLSFQYTICIFIEKDLLVGTAAL